MKSIIWWVIVAVALLGGGGYIYTHKEILNIVEPANTVDTQPQ